MTQPTLDPEEMAALRAAMAPPGGAPAFERGLEDDASPIALIGDDRVARVAGPIATRIGQRWAAALATRWKRNGHGKLELRPSEAVPVDAGPLRDELADAWAATVTVSGRPGVGIVAVSGGFIEAMAARLLGGAAAAPPPADVQRPPSSVARSVFGAVGRIFVAALVDAFDQEQSCHVVEGATPVQGATLARALADADVILCAELRIEGDAPARVRLLAPPALFLAPAAPPPSAPPGAVERALGQVTVEVSVELGKACLSVERIAQLRVGDVMPLDAVLEDLLPVRCGGVVKAWGKALVQRGLLAVEIVDHGRRTAAENEGGNR